MKKIKIEKIQPSERLVNLIEKIPELEIYDGYVYFTDSKDPIYSLITNSIDFNANEDEWNYRDEHLLNHSVFDVFLAKEISNISQDQFCDILEEHLYLKARQKIGELLPQIREYLEGATIKETNLESYNALYIYNKGNENFIVEYDFENHELVKRNTAVYAHLWEDKESLIVKKKNPMPQIKRGYAINEKRSCVICADDKFEKYMTIEDLTVIDTFAPEEINKIYDENDNLIWEKENNEN